MNTLEVLIAARKVIEKPENWTQGVLAKNRYGNAVYVYSEEAACFCSMGALYRAVDEDDCLKTNIIDDVAAILSSIVQDDTVAGFNDKSTHAEVLALFDKAIEMEKVK